MISDKIFDNDKNYRETLIIEEIWQWKMDHKCDRESCPPANVNGPKSTCIKCRKICYLLCYGAEKSSSGMVAFKLQNNLTIFVEVMGTQFACNECVSSGNVVAQSMLQRTKKNETTEITNAQLMEALTAGFMDVKEHFNTNSDKNHTEVKNCMQMITETVKKTSSTIAPPCESANRQSYSSVLRKKILFTTPVSTKRKRSDDNDDGMDGGVNKTAKQIQSSMPKPMTGRSEATIGQKPKPKERKQMRPLSNRFEKSLRVAGLDPSVTVDELCDYIMTNTSLKDKSKFACSMLVKRGQDLSTLTYVSAKVDVSSEDYDRLMNMDLWPNYVTVREFVRTNGRNERRNEINESNPNKLHRKDDANGIETVTNPTTSGDAKEVQHGLGFQEGSDMEVQN